MRESPGVLQELRIEDFRCFPSADLQPSPRFNLILGDNASGKTSLLEALFILGRGLSFRAARPEAAVRYGAPLLRVVGRLSPGGPATRVGVEVSPADGSTFRIDGSAATRADLASAVPCQLLDPSSHELVRGPPAKRREFLDWGVFHVEHSFLGHWQRYRRALNQRNAALRAGDAESAWAWDESLATAGVAVDECRRRGLAQLAVAAAPLAAELLGDEITLSYQRGWADDLGLLDALARNRSRDQVMASSQVGPHRADIRMELRERRVRETVSRGQEKLIAAALTLAQVAQVQAALGRSVALLVDEPGADLDRGRLALLQTSLHRSPAQVWVTALRPEVLQVPSEGKRFHVEHGQAIPLL